MSTDYVGKYQNAGVFLDKGNRPSQDRGDLGQVANGRQCLMSKIVRTGGTHPPPDPRARPSPIYSIYDPMALDLLPFLFTKLGSRMVA